MMPNVQVGTIPIAKESPGMAEVLALLSEPIVGFPSLSEKNEEATIRAALHFSEAAYFPDLLLVEQVSCPSRV